MERKVLLLALMTMMGLNFTQSSTAQMPVPPLRSVAEITKEITAKPTTALLYSERGCAYKSQNQYNESLADFKKAIELKGLEPAANYAGIGSSYLGLKEYSLAKRAFDQSIAADPSWAYTYARRGLTLALLNRYPEAETDFERAIKLDPANIGIHLDAGTTYVGGHKFDKAVKAFTKVIELRGGDASVFRLRGLSLRHLNKFNESLQDFDKSIQLEPNAKAYLGRGMTYFELEKYDLALADYATGIRLDPSEKRFAEARDKALQAKKAAVVTGVDGKNNIGNDSGKRSDVEDEIISRHINVAKATPELVIWLLNGAKNQGPTQLTESRAYLKRVRPDLASLIDNFEQKKVDDAQAALIAKIRRLTRTSALQYLHRAEEQEWNILHNSKDRGLVLRTKANIKRLRPDLAEIVDEYGKTPEEIERMKLIPQLEPSVVRSKQEKLRIALRLIQIYEKEGDFFGAMIYTSTINNMLYPQRDPQIVRKMMQLQIKQAEVERQGL